jgi:hypothetical protein
MIYPNDHIREKAYELGRSDANNGIIRNMPEWIMNDADRRGKGQSERKTRCRELCAAYQDGFKAGNYVCRGRNKYKDMDMGIRSLAGVHGVD